MSCQILVESPETNCEFDNSTITTNVNASLIEGRASPLRNRLGQRNNVTDFLNFLTRKIFFRRLRLLKIYMATVVIFLLLFLIFKPNSTTELSEDSTNPLSTSHVLRDGADRDSRVLESSSHLTDSILDLSSNDQHDLHQNFAVKPTLKPTKSIRYETKNFSYTLSGEDFAHTKVGIMQIRIREAAKHSWDNYRRYAWGYDMLKPRSKEPDHWFDLGLTIVDSADTLIMMGLTNEARSAIDWMENELTFESKNENSNCFEMTIRILAGLLSTHHLTGSEKLKQQAIKFGDILLHCYDTSSGIIPYSDIDLGTHKAHPPVWNPASSLSEITSLQLEFRYLTQISGDPKYEQTTFRTSIHIHNLTETREQKLLPMYVNPTSGQLEESIITLGARSDSYYEYLLKQYLQTGIKWLETDYLDSMDQVWKQLVRHTGGIENYTYVAEMQIYRTVNDTEDIRYSDKMDHLVCFLPGTLALGYYHFSPLASEYRLRYNLETPLNKLNDRYDNHLSMAKAIARTCYHMYSKMGTGLSPEIASFVHDEPGDPTKTGQAELQVQVQSAHNILRPEFVESLFYLYHITGLPIYRDQATEIFEAFQKYSRISSGFSAISDVRIKPETSSNIDELLHKHAPDRMESFWLSETLKYLYLIFCDDKHIVGTILNNYVFNTEAHLIPVV